MILQLIARGFLSFSKTRAYGNILAAPPRPKKSGNQPRYNHRPRQPSVAIRTVFARFAELGSVRRVWLWLRTEGLSFPMQTRYGGGVRWVDADSFIRMEAHLAILIAPHEAHGKAAA